MTATAPAAIRPHDYLSIDHVLSEEERDIRDMVRGFVADQVLPHIGDWFEEGRIPTELAGEELRVVGADLVQHRPDADLRRRRRERQGRGAEEE